MSPMYNNVLTTLTITDFDFLYIHVSKFLDLQQLIQIM